MFWKVFVPLTIAAFVFGFPIAEFMVHGFNASLWPNTIHSPSVWFSAMVQSYGLDCLLAYRDMAIGQTKALGPYGRIAFASIFAGPAVALVTCFIPNYGPRRDPYGTYGNARWATRQERRQMNIGVELGLDPVTTRPIRVTTESHIVTIAPPRTGKTSGLLIPNLVVPDNNGWNGPAIVIDPKGEAYRAVVARRKALGRTVRCLDPIGIVGGTDSWNPLANMNPKNILHLQRIARALLPEYVAGESVYFQNRAVAVIVGAFLVAHSRNRANPATAGWLLANLTVFEKYLKPLKGDAAAAARSVLEMDPKGRDSIVSTAAQAFSWCTDPRLQRLTHTSTFSMSGGPQCADNQTLTWRTFLTLVSVRRDNGDPVTTLEARSLGLVKHHAIRNKLKFCDRMEVFAMPRRESVLIRLQRSTEFRVIVNDRDLLEAEAVANHVNASDCAVLVHRCETLFPEINPCCVTVSKNVRPSK